MWLAISWLFNNKQTEYHIWQYVWKLTCFTHLSYHQCNLKRRLPLATPFLSYTD